jgi:DNA-binding NarL/FixJ family response regulator
MVLEGAIWLDPAIARMVMQTLPIAAEPMPSDKPDPVEQTSGKKGRVRYNAELTDRELEVLKLIVDGKSNKEIAVLLDVSAHTAKAHVGSIIQKLAVDDRTQVAVKALRDGLI